MRRTDTICDRCGAVCDGTSSVWQVSHSGFSFTALNKLLKKAIRNMDSQWDLCIGCARSLEEWKASPLPGAARAQGSDPSGPHSADPDGSA